MTGKCKRCKEVDRLFERPDGNYCYSCKRVTPIPGQRTGLDPIVPEKKVRKKKV